MLSFPYVTHWAHWEAQLSVAMVDPQLGCIVWVHLLHAQLGDGPF